MYKKQLKEALLKEPVVKVMMKDKDNTLTPTKLDELIDKVHRTQLALLRRFGVLFLDYSSRSQYKPKPTDKEMIDLLKRAALFELTGQSLEPSSLKNNR